MPELFCPKCGTVYHSISGKCCGMDSVLFDMNEHGRSLISKSNAWIDVYDRWKDNPLFKQIEGELLEMHCFSASVCLNEFIERVGLEK